ncbi:MAG TPA: Crp/Fnr family transcriptional regulator [Vicinamibacterales bacterium]|nr:Crp/Fnr family transcriptional regulator [Vicinamibacterales bacterium]
MESVSILRHVPLFADLAPAELEIVAGASRRKSYPRGSIVFSEGDHGDYLLVVLKGRVKVSLLGKDHQETIVRILERPEFVGEIALIDEAPRSATVIALERTEVLEIARDAFVKLVRKQPAISLKVMTQLARALRRATEQIRTLSMFDVYGRVLRCLLTMALDKGENTRARMVIRPRPSIAELAHMVGCERETVSRAMKTLRASGYVTDVDRGLAVEERAIRQYLQPTLQNLAVQSDEAIPHAS